MEDNYEVIILIRKLWPGNYLIFLDRFFFLFFLLPPEMGTHPVRLSILLLFFLSFFVFCFVLGL